MTHSFFIVSLTMLLSLCAFVRESSAQEAGGNYTYEGLLAIGHAKYVAKDYAGALEQYKKAKSSEPAKAEAYYFIGCTLKQEKKYQEAATSLASAVTVAGESNPAIHAKALFVMAVVWEMASNMEKAKFAWADYAAYAKLHPDNHPFVTVADDRMKVLLNRESQLKQYQVVRDRIAQKTE